MKKILIVDDEEPIRRSIREILEIEDYEIFEAEDGEEAIRLVQSDEPHLVITDIIMPEKEGFETILQINEEYPDIKIIAMSGGGRLGTDIILGTVSELNVVGTLRTRPTGAGLETFPILLLATFLSFRSDQDGCRSRACLYRKISSSESSCSSFSQFPHLARASNSKRSD